MILDNIDRFLFIIKDNHVFINVNICKNPNVQPKVFLLFLTDFDQCKKSALFRNIGKHNRSFGYGNRISFFFGLKRSF